MLEKVPEAVGRAMRKLHAGFDKIVYADEAFATVPETLVLESAAFPDGGAMPGRYTQDGEKVSPPLAWRSAPSGAVSMVLIVEDPDAPTPSPLTHLLAWDLPVQGEASEGAFKSPGGPGQEEDVGRNSFFKAGYLPPDPPTGHGPHRYVFQLFALDVQPDLDGTPGKGAVVDAMRGRVIAKGRLIGTYERL